MLLSLAREGRREATCHVHEVTDLMELQRRHKPRHRSQAPVTGPPVSPNSDGEPAPGLPLQARHTAPIGTVLAHPSQTAEEEEETKSLQVLCTELLDVSASPASVMVRPCGEGGPTTTPTRKARRAAAGPRDLLPSVQ